jgi:cytidylate kinase
MAKKIIITIDGWSSCGKNTLAKQLAKELGYVYVDSGAMYRAITLFFLRNHIDWTEKKR